MKYIKLTGWGNNKTHLIPVNKITCFTDEGKYTSVRLVSDNTVNVIENIGTVEELLDLAGAKFYDELDIIDKTGGEDAWDVTPYGPDDDLPF